MSELQFFGHIVDNEEVESLDGKRFDVWNPYTRQVWAQAAEGSEPWFAAYVDATATPAYPFEAPAAATDGNVVLSVRDDGEGIPESDQKRIFNAFEQSRHTIHDRYDTGMGLTFCKLAVEKHGGRIWVESKVGRGSTFYFTLPERVPTVVGGA